METAFADAVNTSANSIAYEQQLAHFFLQTTQTHMLHTQMQRATGA